MKTNSFINIICPVSNNKINENAARISALLTFITAGIGLYFNSFLVFLFLVADFSIRAFTSQGNSPIRLLTQFIVKKFNIKNKPIDAAQKRFAAELGFILCVAICFFQYFDNYTLTNVLGGVLLFFAFLESAFSFCFGCIIYTYIALPLLRKDKS